MKYRKCKICGRSGPRIYVSRKGKCSRCAFKELRNIAKELRAKKGPYFERWAKGYIKYAISMSKKMSNVKDKNRLGFERK